MKTTFQTEAEAVTYIFRSLRRLRGVERGTDDQTRDTAPTQVLLSAANLLATPREYAVVTGSKGKGSTTLMTAKILQGLGHTVGMMTSPHLVSFRERVRVNGRAIPEADFCRILGELAPDIDRIEEGLAASRYFSPQGIFLAIALRHFDEQGVNAAVLEVGRGGRFDDIAVVPNRLSLFSPIMFEHPHQLGPTLERIAWHKAGIIKPLSYAYSVPQAAEVLDVLLAEAEALDAEFHWLPPVDLGEFVAETEHGQRIRLGRYGEFELGLPGRYQISNAALAVQGAGNMHARLPGIGHGTPEYAQAVRSALGSAQWPGRLTKLQDAPAVWVDGAINAESAALLVASVTHRLTRPTVAILAVPDDKDAEGVYRELGQIADHVIVTETARNLTLHFAPPETALALARRYHSGASYAPTLDAALEKALALAGTGGTILIVGTQSIVADAAAHYGQSYEVI